VVIHLLATFGAICGVKEITLNLPENSTIRQVVQEIIRLYPVLRPKWIDEAGELYPYVHIYHQRGSTAGLVHHLDAAVEPEDILDFFPPVAGG
jgi:sulfur-carrier protein